MRHRAFALFLGAVLACAAAVPACAGMYDRLQQQHFGDIKPGTYQAGDNLRFTLDRYQNEFLMRLVGQPEVYVLYADFASLGGRVLRYDSGGIAIQVTGWGAMTLYTDSSPDGLPTTRVGDSSTPSPAQVSPQQFQSTAEDEADRLSDARGIHLSITADPNALADGTTRALAYDAMENAVRGIDRFTANAAARILFSQRVNAVRMQISPKPFIKITDKVLIVTFNPQTGFLGRASSRAIAFALGKVFNIPMPN